MRSTTSDPADPTGIRFSTPTGPRACRIRAVAVPVLVAGFLALAAVACGGNLTAGGFGEVEVSVTADAPEAALPAAWPSEANASISLTDPASPAPGTAVSDHDDEPEGKLEMEFLLYLIRDDGAVVEVDDKEIEVELDLAGFFEADAVTSVLPAARYVGLRIKFTEIEVEVERGVIVNGVPITGPIEVELGDDESITIERPLDAVLEDGGRIEILLDMNSRVWLSAIDPDVRNVAESVFAEAIRVVVR